jgi:hypothetical protein
MKVKGYDVIRHETLFCAGEYGGYHEYDPIEWYNTYAKDRHPIFVLRDPIKRIFSHYHYKQNHQKGDFHEIKEKTLEEALKNHQYIIQQSNYDKYLKQWLHLFPTILYIEDIIKWDGFPHDNTCECKDKMTDIDKKLIMNLINYELHFKYKNKI